LIIRVLSLDAGLPLKIIYSLLLASILISTQVVFARKNKYGLKDYLLWILSHSILMVNVAIVLIPITWMVSASFTAGDLLSGVPVIPNPSEWTLDNYKYLFEYRRSSDQFLSDYLKAFSTTLYISVLNTILVVVLSSLVGFAFSRYKFKGRKGILLTLMGLQMFPAFMGMIALFMMFRQFGLINNATALTFIYVAGAIPYNTFIVRGFMRSIPKSLDEAASIDGASNLQIMTKIIIPLAIPIMGFIAVTAFMTPWMDFILPSIMMPQNETLAVWLFRFNHLTNATYRPLKFMAGALVIAVPIIIVQMYMQKYVVYGLTAGADKG